MSYPVRRTSQQPGAGGWWDPFAELEALRRRLDQLFGTPSGRWGAEWAGDVDFEETDDGWTVEAPLPGVPPENVDIEVTERELTIRGSAGKEDEAEGRRARGRREYNYRLTLPGEVDTDRVEANLENGILTLTLPRSPRAAAKKIQVGRGAGRPEITGAGAGATTAQAETTPEAQEATQPWEAPPSGEQAPGGQPYQPAEGRYPVPGQDRPLPDQPPPPNYGYEQYPQPGTQQPGQQQPDQPYQVWPDQGADRERRDQPT